VARMSSFGILAMSNFPKYRGQPGLTPVYDPELSHGSNRSATSARVVRSPRAHRHQASGRRGDGCLRIGQKHRRGPARRRAGLSFPGGRRPTPARECREDAQRDSADRRRPAALAAQDRRGDRRLARAGRVRRADLLGAEAILPGPHHRRPPRRGAGLPQRFARSDSPAHGRAARAFHADCPAGQPVRDIGGADARRAPDDRRCRRQTGRDRPRDRVPARGPAA
jgi:hypothetical protein